MAHVIARHAAIREDQARQAAIVSQVVTRRAQRSRDGRARPGKSPRSSWRASRARRNSRPTASASASRRVPASIPSGPRASSRRSAAMPSSTPTGEPGKDPPQSGISLDPSGDAGTRRQRDALNAKQYTAPSGHERDRNRPISQAVDGSVFGEDPSEGYRARAPLPAREARLHLHGAGRIYARQYGPGGARREGWRQPGASPRRGARCRRSRSSRIISAPAGSPILEPNSIESLNVNGFAAATATAKNDQWTFRLYAIRFGSDVYRFIFAGKAQERRDGPCVSPVHRELPAHDAWPRSSAPARCG